MVSVKLCTNFIKCLHLQTTSSPDNLGYYTEKFNIGHQTLFTKHLDINSNRKKGKRLRRGNLGKLKVMMTSEEQIISSDKRRSICDLNISAPPPPQWPINYFEEYYNM